jgi:mannosyltransferase OCH1-like enzyme
MTSNSIPEIIHQIWIGPKPRPVEWMQTWEQMNPNMGYALWDEELLQDFGLRYKKQFDYLYSVGEYRGASDIARVEIIERLGGVYIDADSVCVKSIEDAPFMQTQFFVNKEFDHKRGEFKNRVQNAHIGAIPHHPIMTQYLDRIADFDVTTTDWMWIGGKTLTELINKQIMLLPICTFTPTNFDGRVAPQEGDTYAEHRWGTTKGTYAS